MQCFEAISIFRVARCFRCHCHFLLGQTLGIHFRRRPLSTIESMPGQRHGVSKEKDDEFEKFDNQHCQNLSKLESLA